MKSRDVYTGNIALAFVLFLFFYLLKLWLLFWIGLGVLLLTLVSFQLATNFASILSKLYKLIGFINSKIILTIFYLIILTPISLLAKLFSPSKKQLTTNWKEVKKAYNFEELW